MPVKIPSTELFMRMSGYPSIGHSLGGDAAITIDARILLDKRTQNNEEYIAPRKFTKRQPSGWTITGRVSHDYYVWCDKFDAVHTEWGFVKLANNTVTANSRLGFERFWYDHGKKMGTFDSGDI